MADEEKIEEPEEALETEELEAGEPEEVLAPEEEPISEEEPADETEEEPADEPVEEPADEPEEEPVSEDDEPAPAPKKAKKSQRVRERKAQKAHAKEEPEKQGYVASAGKKGGVSGGILALACALCLVAGALLGHFLPIGGSGSAGNQIAGVTSLTEEQLDEAVAAYTINGETTPVTAREVIESMSTLEDYVGEDGTYNVPSADSVLSFIRNEVLNNAVVEAGITVTDEDVAAYAEEVLGSSDLEEIATMYGMDVEVVTEMIRDSAGVRALYDQVVSTNGLEPPMAPTPCEEGDEEVATAEYGAYIMNLIGDEWDTENETWARQDGPYYAALAAESFTSDSANFNQATSAYYVAYQVYATEQSNVTAKWTEYVNGLFSGVSVDVYSLVS